MAKTPLDHYAVTTSDPRLTPLEPHYDRLFTHSRFWTVRTHAKLREPEMALEKWDARFLDVAKLAAQWSKDPNARVGAVIVDAQGQIAGVGYNGFPKLVEDSAERYGDVETKLEMVVHAEENAVLGASVRARKGSIYVFGKPVCARYAGTIIQSGVQRVIAQPPQEHTDSKWDRSGKIARRMFDEAGVQFVPTTA